jgi:hypothetical protein
METLRDKITKILSRRQPMTYWQGAYADQIISLFEEIIPKEKETCECENSELGYHTKECDFTPYGYNEAIKEIKSKLK